MPWGILALAGVGGTVAIASKGTASTDAVAGVGALGAVVAGITAHWAASAAYGYSALAACREAKARLVGRLVAHGPAAAVAQGEAAGQPRGLSPGGA